MWKREIINILRTFCDSKAVFGELASNVGGKATIQHLSSYQMGRDVLMFEHQNIAIELNADIL